MARRHILWVVLIVVACSGLSAWVAYRRGLHRSAWPYTAGFGSGAGPKGGCVDFKDAGPHVGETLCVSGRVLRVFTSRGGTTFLDFCTDYRTCPFTSVIFSSDRSRFGNLQTLEGRRVELEGSVTSYQGHAEIIIRDPQQIRVVP